MLSRFWPKSRLQTRRATEFWSRIGLKEPFPSGAWRKTLSKDIVRVPGRLLGGQDRDGAGIDAVKGLGPLIPRATRKNGREARVHPGPSIAIVLVGKVARYLTVKEHV